MKTKVVILIAVICIIIGLLLVGGCLLGLYTDIPQAILTQMTSSTTTQTEATTTTTTPVTTTHGPTQTVSHIIKGVPIIKQFPAYPTGCETISAMMVLQYFNETVSTEEFINNHLEKGGFYSKDGKLYGPNPYDKFVGDPRTTSSLGCFAPVMERALKSYFGDDGRVQNTTGLTLDQLCAQYIENDIPVLVWSTIYMEQVGTGSVWYDEKTGEKLQWRTNEHCMVLVGYDATHYYFNDPYSGRQLRFAKVVVNDRHAKFECQSIVVTK